MKMYETRRRRAMQKRTTSERVMLAYASELPSSPFTPRTGSAALDLYFRRRPSSSASARGGGAGFPASGPRPATAAGGANCAQHRDDGVQPDAAAHDQNVIFCGKCDAVLFALG